MLYFINVAGKFLNYIYNVYIYNPVSRSIYFLIIFVSLGGCGHGDDPQKAFEKGDYVTAYKLWVPLAESGDNEAQNYLGIHYYLGLGVERDMDQAKNWFEKAAVNGYPDAQYNLGQMYENAQSVSQDYVTAYMWFYAAYEQGNENARKHMKSISEEHKLFPNQMRHAQELAKPYILTYTK